MYATIALFLLLAYDKCMSLGLIEIRSVLVVARKRSLSAAAEELHISQPALSRRIAQAEDSLGVPLFERLPRGVAPTDACLAFLRHAEAALTAIDDAHEAALESRNESRRELALGFIEASCGPWMTDAVRQVMAAKPDTLPIFRPHITSEQVSADILSGEVKLGVRYRRDDNPLIESMTLFDDQLAVICAPQHPLTGRSDVTVDELARQQWLGYPVSQHGATSFNSILATRGFGAWRIISLDSARTQELLVAAGFGIALVRRANVARAIAEGQFVEIQTPVAASVPVMLAWRRDAHLGERSEMLREQLAVEAKRAHG